MQVIVKGQEIYLPEVVFDQLAAKLVKMIEQPINECTTDPQTEVVMALGEIANVWSAGVLEDADEVAEPVAA